MIHTEDNKIMINYPLNIKEEGIQAIVYELKNMNISNKIIKLDTDDIAISLVFYFKDLITSDEDIVIEVTQKVYNMLIGNFGEIFKSDKLRVTDE